MIEVRELLYELSIYFFLHGSCHLYGTWGTQILDPIDWSAWSDRIAWIGIPSCQSRENSLDRSLATSQMS